MDDVSTIEWANYRGKSEDALKAKFNAWVGKYRMTLAVLPLQRARTPSSRVVRAKQSPMPL